MVKNPNMIIDTPMKSIHSNIDITSIADPPFSSHLDPFSNHKLTKQLMQKSKNLSKKNLIG